MDSLRHYIPYAHMAATVFGLIELGLTCYRKSFSSPPHHLLQSNITRFLTFLQ